MQKTMNHKLIWIIILTMLAVPTNVLANTSDDQDISVMLNGVKLSFDQSSVIQNGSTLVPFRGILEELGAYVDWDSKTKAVTAIKNGTRIKLTLDSNLSMVNGTIYQMPLKVQVLNGRTMIPLRFISEHLNSQVTWNGKTKTIHINTKQNDTVPILYSTELKDSYDVIVVGGDPEGVAAAVAAARNGAKTLLVEEQDGLGGLLTYGMLNQLDLGYDKDQQLANQGVFLEWLKMIGGKGTFDIQEGKDAFLSLLQQEKNITLSLNTQVTKGLKDGNRLVGVTLRTPEGDRSVSAKRFIDATADADFAAMVGVPYFVGQEDIGLKDTKMAVTLVMVFKDVNWDGVRLAAKSGVFGGGKADDTMAWGFGDIKDSYKPIATNTRLRGLNIGKQKNGNVTINALQIFDVDGLDSDSIESAMEIGKEETHHILKFLQANFPGFEQAKIATYPEELYIRETRHIKAEYQLSIVDVWENRDQWDSIGFGAYPVDVQATAVNGYGYYVTKPIQYAIPYRSIVPLEVDGLLVASKASGYSSLAAGSARTVPIGMTAGEAAGTASAISIAKNISFRDMIKNESVIAELQAKLRNQGALLYAFDLDFPYKGEWFYPAIRTLLPYGLIQAGYNNDLKVDEVMPERQFLKLLSNAIYQSDFEKHSQFTETDKLWDQAMETDFSVKLTRDSAAEILTIYFGIEEQLTDRNDRWNVLREKGFIDDFIFEKINKNRPILNSEGYYIVAYLVEYLSD